MTRRIACGFASALLCVLMSNAAGAFAAEPAGRVLFIGIDGCRFDALEKADAPNLDRLRAEGCYSDRTLILGDRSRGNNTVSGPGWSSLLTGVWADKHGVNSNKFETPHYDRFPHFFRRVKDAFPQAMTASIAGWPPIAQKIVSAADVNEETSEAEKYVPGDELAAKRAVDLLRHADPTVLFVYFGQVDEHGHSFGFSPDVPEYVKAIERVDGHVGLVLGALRARRNYATENWLVLVSTDHGGKGKDHGNGHNVPEILHGFTIVNGAASDRGRIEQTTYLVDVPVTALAHIGVKLDPEWKLDGKPVGLRKNQD